MYPLSVFIGEGGGSLATGGKWNGVLPPPAREVMETERRREERVMAARAVPLSTRRGGTTLSRRSSSSLSVERWSGFGEGGTMTAGAADTVDSTEGTRGRKD